MLRPFPIYKAVLLFKKKNGRRYDVDGLQEVLFNFIAHCIKGYGIFYWLQQHEIKVNLIVHFYYNSIFFISFKKVSNLSNFLQVKSQSFSL